MRVRTLLLAVVAVGAASGAALLAQDWLTAQQAALQAELDAARVKQEPVKVETARVLVAARDLPAGSFVKEANLSWVDWPKEGILDVYFNEEETSFEDLSGAVVRTGLTNGEPLTQGRIVRPGENGFLAAVLRNGMRAVSVPINATTGISGFVFPGDNVDLLLTQSIKNGSSVRRASETVLRDIRVLAVDQRVNDQEGTPALGKTVTLEVSPKETEIIAVAMEIGRLSLALRSLPLEAGQGEEGTVEDTAEEIALLKQGEALSLTWDSQASRAIGGVPVSEDAPPPPPTFKVNVVRGNNVQTFAFKGGN